MANLTTHELRLIARKRGIKSYKNMSRETLLSTLEELESIFKNLSQNEYKRIAKMQSLSQNELSQITKMQDLSQNELEEIAKTRHLKNCKNVSKEELFIFLLKSEQSIAEFHKTNSINTEIEEIKKNLLRSEIIFQMKN